MDVPPSPWQSVPRTPAVFGTGAKLGYFAALLVFTASAVIAILSADAVRTHGQDASDRIEFLGALERTFSLLQDAETGQRGFLITEDPAFLAPYNTALGRLSDSLAQLRASDAKIAQGSDWYQDFERAVDAKLADLAFVIQLVAEGRDAEAVSVEIQESGRVRMDEVRALVDQRREMEVSNMRQARDAAVHSLERAVIMGVGAAILGISIVAVSFFRLRHESAARLEVAEDLVRQREELRVTLLSIGDGVIATDQDGRVKALNDIAERLTGWKSDEAVGRRIDEIFRIENEATRETVENPALVALREDKSVDLSDQHTVLMSQEGTEYVIDDSAAPIRDASGKLLGAVLVFRDVTKQRRAQAELEENQRRKDEFLAMLGHELRNPLAGILTGVQVLHMLGAQGDAARMQEVIERQAAHMSRMVDDLLDISRFSRGKLVLKVEHLDVRTFLKVTVDDYRESQLIENCELVLEVPDCEVWVRGDRTRLAQAVSNLIHNACKFCDGENRVTIGLTVDEASGHALLHVSDMGIGMDRETLARVFQPFIQADTSIDRSRGGLGLGLALVHGIVRLHNGEVSAFSEGQGRGSRFTIRLPLAEKPALQPIEPAAMQSGARRVLVIDDRRDAIIPLKKMLEIEGHDVRTASNGRDGIAAARQFVPDVVLCDIGLAEGMNGYEVAAAMRQLPELAGTYLIAVTGYGQEEDRQQALAAGFDFHLTKPVGKQGLDQLMRDLPAHRKASPTA